MVSTSAVTASSRGRLEPAPSAAERLRQASIHPDVPRCAAFRSASHGFSGGSRIRRGGISLAAPANGDMTLRPDARTTTHAH